MKKNFYYFFLCLILYNSNKIIAQNANTSLSNLTSPTKINTNLLPVNGNTYNLGLPSKSWKNIYIKGSVYFDGVKFISNAGLFNTYIGGDAGHSTTTGNNNVATGNGALYSNTTGSTNVANGVNALHYNTTGYANTANGLSALFTNTTGYYNSANGYQALLYNTTGLFNTATGAEALSGNTTGGYNTANGTFALYRNAGNYNTGNGAYALYNNTSGTSNTADGQGVLYSNTTGSYNTASGVGALYYNTTGYYNTANGLDALFENTTGIHNTGVGLNALFWNSAGSYNTALGNYTLTNNTTSQFNTAVGYAAGYTYVNGYNNVFLGAETDVNSAGYYNVVAVGHSTICTASSQARIGNSYTTSIGGYANWSNVSDVRVKKNIKQNVPGLAFINKLQPITYNLDLAAADKIIQAPVIKDKDGKILQPTQQQLDARKAKEQIIYSGFAAQDVEKAAKSLNYDFSGVDAAKNNKDLYGLRYAEFVVPLVKAVQELSKINDDKEASIDSLRNENKNLTARISKLETMMNVSMQSTSVSSQSSTTISSASLEQNIPNPFSNTTTIHYTLPQQYSSAKIIVTNNNGVVLKIINLHNKGKGSLNVDASTLSSGAYQYSLIIDDRIITSKQMLLSK